MNFLEEGFGVLLKFQKTWEKACSLPTLRMNTTSFLVKRSRDGQKNQEVQSGFSVPLDFSIYVAYIILMRFLPY